MLTAARQPPVKPQLNQPSTILKNFDPDIAIPLSNYFFLNIKMGINSRLSSPENNIQIITDGQTDKVSYLADFQL